MNRNQTYKFPFASLPALRIALLMIAGTILSAKVSCDLRYTGLILFFILIIWVISETVIRKRRQFASSFIAIISYLLLIILIFNIYSEFRNKIDSLETTPAEVINLFEWDELVIEGLIEKAGNSSSGQRVFVVLTEKTFFNQKQEWNVPYRIRLYGDAAEHDTLKTGDRIRSIIRIYHFPDQRNPNEFNYGNWLIKNGIAVHGEIEKILHIDNGAKRGWNSLRSTVQNSADNLFQKENSSIAKALLLGYKEELSQEFKQQFSRSGLSHIMAVSGLHVGFIVAPFWLMIPYFWGSQKGRWLGLLILTALLIGYAGLTGFSPSVSRASLMAWLLTYGKLFHKIRNSINLTALAAIIILLVEPKELFEVGFQLSFCAVFIILMLMPEAQQCIPSRYRYGVIGSFTSIIVVSIVVQLGLFPILVYYFGEFSVIGPVANALVVPILTFTVPVGLLLVVISPVANSFFQKLASVIELTLNWIEWVAESLGSNQFSYIEIESISWPIFIVWIFLIFLLAAMRIPAIRWKLLILLLLSLNTTLLHTYFRSSPYLEMEVTFLDVGQADAIHIRTPNRREVLIDTGRWSPMSNSGERVLLPYFEHYKIASLDAVFLSHPHADHIGGMPSLMEGMRIKKIYQSDFEYDSVLFQTIMRLSEQMNTEVVYPVAGDIIDLDPDIRIFVLGPEPGKSFDRNPNNHSLAVKIIYGDTEFLFTGDAETRQERQIAGRYGFFLKSDLYKAGHHGSNSSSTEVFLKNVQPDITVTSLALRNGFGHPGRDAVNRIHQYSKSHNFTSLSGAIRFTSNGSEIKKVNWRE